MQRRQFLQALAASVVAVGAPLPVGFPEDLSAERNLLGEQEEYIGWRGWHTSAIVNKSWLVRV